MSYRPRLVKAPWEPGAGPTAPVRPAAKRAEGDSREVKRIVLHGGLWEALIEARTAGLGVEDIERVVNEVLTDFGLRRGGRRG